MVEWWWLIIVAVIAGAVGMFCTAICFVAQRADRHIEAYLAADMCRQCAVRGDIDPAYLFDAQKGERECSHGR